MPVPRSLTDGDLVLRLPSEADVARMWWGGGRRRGASTHADGAPWGAVRRCGARPCYSMSLTASRSSVSSATVASSFSWVNDVSSRPCTIS
jgi:hypothetical protein